jgi:phosphate starvation-inducible protein PhoH and related proteins
MSKKQRNKHNNDIFELYEIEPLTKNQLLAFESDKNLVLCGSAGTGKTFVSCYLAFDDIIKNHYARLILIRSAVSTRDIGFLPGTEEEKAKVYEEPYYAIFGEIFQRGDAYKILKEKGWLEFMITSYIRGLTINDSVVIVDECQNMTLHELDSIITRIGQNCRIIFCGDFKQSDLKTNGMHDFLKVLRAMNEFDVIEYTVDDIVRSEFVKNYLIAKERMLV